MSTKADPSPSVPVSPGEARLLILRGAMQTGLRIAGRLDLSKSAITHLPPDLTVDTLDVSGCTQLRTLPPGLRARKVVAGGSALRDLPPGLSLYELDLRGTAVATLPADLRVEFRLDLEACRSLRSLPAGLKVGSLNLRECTDLETLPEGLEVSFLDLSGCTSLTSWPQTGSIRVGHLSVNACPWVRELPPWINDLAGLDVGGCAGLRRLPEGLRVSSWVEIAGSGLSDLPPSLEGVRIRWRGVPVSRRIAFQPETITVAEVLGERNAELRRVLLERMGYERFIDEAGARVRHQDRDPGGERRLLHVPIPDDEDLVCLSVLCPSTARRYLLRVPPQTRTCHQAAAWIAGFDNPNDYHPVEET
ncbi:MAG TPA: hypothetical protein VK689_03555 [Armatimonadota bacterium]|nr:hypothetical protein [Armatimonadota bacterium]